MRSFSRPEREPRRPVAFDGSGAHVLRTLDDARRLRGELLPGRRLAIVGSGFVGTEVASTAAELAVDVMLIDPGSLPFERTLGPAVGRLLASRYRGHGVDLRLGARVESVLHRSDGTLRGLRLSDGTELEHDLVLVAVGAEPAGELLRRRPGPIEIDEGGRTGFPGIYACGDVDAAWSAEHSRHVRLEHWTSAARQAAVVARGILGAAPGARPAPYFWSDQFGLRLQHVGSTEGWEQVILDGDETSLTARYLAEDGRLVAALPVNRPRQVGSLRLELATELLAA
jgi:NADPH-dependent 2,4-dienoyl-CoA reductase/sulfur reductase-like enzyme